MNILFCIYEIQFAVILMYNNVLGFDLPEFKNLTPVTVRTIQLTLVESRLEKKDVSKYIRPANLKHCAKEPLGLGVFTVDRRPISLTNIEKKYPEIEYGGLFTPESCRGRHRVAIIIPFRNRMTQLLVLLNNLHPMLMAQQLEYGIYVIEQYGDAVFNKGKLLNVGFKESQWLGGGRWQCFIFHDVGTVPTDSRNMYSCPNLPKHYSPAIDVFQYRLPYETLFGGVVGMTIKQFTEINGFSNKYWGWGGEDDDLHNRIKEVGSDIERSNFTIGRYITLRHKKSRANPRRFHLLAQTASTYDKDGLSSLTYKVINVSEHRLYTHVLVDIDKRHKRYYSTTEYQYQ